MSVLGKTIARIDENPRDPDYGGEDHGSVILYFTDGTALHIEGHSYESVDLSLEPLSGADVRARNAQVQGQRERARLGRLKRQEWMAVSCEERQRRRVATEATRGPFALMMGKAMQDNYTDAMLASCRQVYGASRAVRLPCENCGERACENAPTKRVA